jgi:hypothetical protein
MIVKNDLKNKPHQNFYFANPLFIKRPVSNAIVILEK